ncbi:MAG: acetyl-CoA carboxylase biotin carboxyl carrier protein subunit [Anaerolineaceae bacterium]|nr:MAG: acetyl-CoA carboxylase biotin carboxyl carrier protein subunit [Anaerolineaceae bacterium]
MKLNVKINEKTYSVEIEDLNTRPIIAVVDGERFEVTPDISPVRSGAQVPVKKEASTATESAPKKMDVPSPASNAKSLPAPLPGTITEIFVKPGDEIESGQVVLVIEAMKMKNSIRSTREGKISAVLASAGQTVTHKQALLEFE